MKFWILILIALGIIGCQPHIDTSSAGKIHYMTSHGSGVFIEDGFLTANHVMQNYHGGPVTITTFDNRQIDIKGLTRGPKNMGKDDWAILYVSVPKNISPAIINCKPVSMQQKVLHVGYPTAGNYSVRVEEFGRIISLDVMENSVGSTRSTLKDLVLISLGVSGGNSGGPVYNKDGEVIGIVVAYLRYTHGQSTHALMIRPPEALCPKDTQHPRVKS